MEKPRTVDPHAIEGHSKAHKEAFDALVERIANATKRQRQEQRERRPFGSRTHRMYPDMWRRSR